MPVYCFICSACGERSEELLSHGDRRKVPACPACGQPMRRDFAQENVHNNFHPTVDLYAKAKKLRKVRSG